MTRKKQLLLFRLVVTTITFLLEQFPEISHIAISDKDITFYRFKQNQHKRATPTVVKRLKRL